MLVLALDTSSPATSCALVELGGPPDRGSHRVLAEELILPPIKAGDLLPDALVALCAKAGRTLDEVTGLAVGLGPGSFTGLRVGLASAKGLAYARRWPLAGASSLHALALTAWRALKLEQGVLIPALEARRGELFLSAYSIADGALVPLAPEQVLQARDVPAWLAQLASPTAQHAGLLLVGPGAAKNIDLLRASGVHADSLQHASQPLWPGAAALAGLCAPQLRASQFDAAALFAIAPLYLAQSEPEKALAEGRVGKLAGA